MRMRRNCDKHRLTRRLKNVLLSNLRVLCGTGILRGCKSGARAGQWFQRAGRTMRGSLPLLGALGLILVLGGHAASADVSGSAAAGRQLKADQPHDYNYIRHGADWGNLGSCSGDAQSPIDIVTSELSDPSDRSGVSGASFNDLPSVNMTNVRVNLEQDMKFIFDDLPRSIALPTITIGDVEHEFTPAQVHFHHFASEHTVDGMHYPLEAHVVMSSNVEDSNQLAVLGILYKFGDADPFISRLQDAAQTKINQGANSYGDKEVSVPVTANVLKDLLPENLDYYGYDGSLTTPTCDEIVKWHVFSTPRTVSVEQLKVFQDVTLAANADAYSTNNRIIQPKNGRDVYLYESAKATIEAVYGVEFESGTIADRAFDKFQSGTRLGCDPANCDPFSGPERQFVMGLQTRAKENTGALSAVISEVTTANRRRSLLQNNIADMTITYTFDRLATQNPKAIVDAFDGSALEGSSDNGLTSTVWKSSEDTTPESGSGASSIRAGLGLVIALIMSVVLAL